VRRFDSRDQPRAGAGALFHRVIELAAAELGWQPTTTLEELVAEMVAVDKEEARKEALLRLKGFQVVGSRE
jgi:nucleoside-diphosphate-sugar epimerase